MIFWKDLEGRITPSCIKSLFRMWDWKGLGWLTIVEVVWMQGFILRTLSWWLFSSFECSNFTQEFSLANFLFRFSVSTALLDLLLVPVPERWFYWDCFFQKKKRFWSGLIGTHEWWTMFVANNWRERDWAENQKTTKVSKCITQIPKTEAKDWRRLRAPNWWNLQKIMHSFQFLIWIPKWPTPLLPLFCVSSQREGGRKMNTTKKRKKERRRRTIWWWSLHTFTERKKRVTTTKKGCLLTE